MGYCSLLDDVALWQCIMKQADTPFFLTVLLVFYAKESTSLDRIDYFDMVIAMKFVRTTYTGKPSNFCLKYQSDSFGTTSASINK